MFCHVMMHHRDVCPCDENGISRHDLLVFGFLYGSLAFIYNYILVNYERYKEIFEIVCIYCSRSVNHMNFGTVVRARACSDEILRYWLLLVVTF